MELVQREDQRNTNMDTVVEFYNAIGKDIMWLLLVNTILLQVLIISKYKVKTQYRVKVRRDVEQTKMQTRLARLEHVFGVVRRKTSSYSPLFKVR